MRIDFSHAIFLMKILEISLHNACFKCLPPKKNYWLKSPKTAKKGEIKEPVPEPDMKENDGLMETATGKIENNKPLKYAPAAAFRGIEKNEPGVL